MERYLGLDVHAQSCTFCILSEAGKEIRREVVETNGQALVGFLKQQPGRLHVCMEEGEWSLWLHETLSPHVAEIVSVWPEAKQGAKSDGLDAHGLAERMRSGRLGRVAYKAPRQFAELRELARVYTLLTRDVVRQKNRLKSLFRRRGVDCPGEEIFQVEGRQNRLSELPKAMWRTVELLGTQLDCLEELKAEATEAMLAQSRQYPIAAVLETAPVQPPRRKGSRVSIHLTNGPAAPPADPIAWLCPLGVPNEDVALKALMDGWFLQRERTTESASKSRQSLSPKQRPHPALRRNVAVIAPGRSMSAPSSARRRYGLDIAFYGRGQSEAAAPGQGEKYFQAPGGGGSRFGRAPIRWRPWGLETKRNSSPGVAAPSSL